MISRREAGSRRRHRRGGGRLRSGREHCGRRIDGPVAETIPADAGLALLAEVVMCDGGVSGHSELAGQHRE
jgi:hypothetical protein